MRLAFISDVHSNLEALQAVLSDIEKRNVSDIHFLGDAVGYGPNPNECIQTLGGTCSELLAGNHDWAVLGLTDIAYFNLYARAAVIWTDEVLSPENRKALEDFSLIRNLEGLGLLLVHSSPVEPGDWNYLFTPSDAALAFYHFSQRICLVGHSHVPFIVEKPASGDVISHGDSVDFSEGSRYIINVGSVGQPRDGDPRAAYAVLDEKGVRIYRVEYPVHETQEKMTAAKLPDSLVSRLSYGR
jgi:predicted phosphodiesterase